MDRSTIVGIELALAWSSVDVEHVDRHYLPGVNLGRDIFPRSLGERLAASRSGTPAQESFGAGELVEPYRDSEVHSLRRSQLATEIGRHRIGPLHRGRFYPAGLGAGAVSGLAPRETRPMRVIDADEARVTLDFNHPLSRYPLTLKGHIDAQPGIREERGRQCNDIARLVTSRGPGLQAALADAPTDFFYPGAFAREDDHDDAAFYRSARLVDHLDAIARARVTEIYARFLAPGTRVLDLMSSWNSHLPETPSDLEVIGLGMNQQELVENPRLSEHLTHDLNSQAALPFADGHFDAAICTMSVEYLTRPIEVFGEVARVLRPGAPFVLTFSERWFPPKVIRLWTELHPFERMGLVLEVFRRSGGFEAMGTDSIRGLSRPADDKYAALIPHSDPVYAVWARRRKPHTPSP
jgi:SAM-dependent methyltransferase